MIFFFRFPLVATQVVVQRKAYTGGHQRHHYPPLAGVKGPRPTCAQLWPVSQSSTFLEVLKMAAMGAGLIQSTSVPPSKGDT